MLREYEIKSWILHQANDKASAYNMDIEWDLNSTTDGHRAGGDYVFVYGEEIKETEKAICIKARTGAIDGSVKGWTLWIPKSQIANVNEVRILEA